MNDNRRAPKAAGIQLPPTRFELDLRSEQLLDPQGRSVELRPQARAVLRHLALNAGRLVTKDELFAAVWPGLVVTDDSLVQAVSVVRAALGEFGYQVIKTVPKRGYIFVADGAALTVVTKAAAATLTRIRTNLPAEQPPLYGRDADVQEVIQLLGQHPLVSIVGPGGIGKTRLSHAVAHEVRDRFVDGVWLIELAALSDPARVSAAVARVLKLTVSDEADALEAAVDAMRGRNVLLVLDNCEHLLDAVSPLADATRRQAPGVRLLVTSQETLNVTDEHVYRLGTLPVPEPDSLPDTNAALHYGAVALFVARAQAADTGFELSADNVEGILEICRRLDGIALAIEFAAARVRLLGVEGLRARLNERFNILSGGHRGALRRHQTLRAALEWSHSLLTDAERIVFRRLSAFVGGFPLELAQEVAADEMMNQWQVLDCLAALVDKSLVVVDPTEPLRYRMLETSRLFAAEKLVAAEEKELLASRHARCLAARFEAAWMERWGAGSAEVFSGLQPELDNLRAALEWSGSNDAELEISLAGAAAWLWLGSGLDAEGIAACERAISHASNATAPNLEARVLSEMAQLGWYVLSLPRALQVLERAIALYRSSGDGVGLYLALARKAGFLASGGEIDRARHALAEVESLETETWPGRLRLERLIARSRVAWFDTDLETFWAAQEERHHFACQVGNERDRLLARGNLVNARVGLGQLEEAVRDGRDLVDQFPRHSLAGAYFGYLLAHLSIALALLGRLNEAVLTLREAAPALRAGAMMWRLLDLVALIAAMRGRKVNAARLFGAGAAIFKRRGRQREVSLDRLHKVVANHLQAAFASQELARMVVEGEVFSEQEAVLAALAEVASGD